MIPGGTLNRYSQSVCGIGAVKELKRVNFSQTFLGVTSYSSGTGFTCGSNDEAILKETAIRQSDQTIVLMDSSKVGVKGTFNICGLDRVDMVISDGNLPEEFLEECRRFQVKVL